MTPGRRWQLVGLGLYLMAMWFACWAATVAPGAEHARWIAGNALAFLAGGVFAAALIVRQDKS